MRHKKIIPFCPTQSLRFILNPIYRKNNTSNWIGVFNNKLVGAWFAESHSVTISQCR